MKYATIFPNEFLGSSKIVNTQDNIAIVMWTNQNQGNIMDKREYRHLKRTLKKEGNKKARKKFKEDLRQNPEEAHFETDLDYGNCKTENMKKYSREKE